MIQILIVKNENKPGLLNKIKSFFAKNEIYRESKHLGDLQINYITIKQKKLSIPWGQVKYLFFDNAKNILCENNLDLPEYLGFTKFDETQFLELLCLNSAIHVIQNLNSNLEDLNVALYDPFCEYSNILNDIIMFSRHLKIITQREDAYFQKIKILSNDYGVCIPISNKISWISPCSILIAPKIDTKFYTSSGTIIFTCKKNIAGLSGIIFNEYKLDICDEIKTLIPKEIPSERFIAALYGSNKFPKLKNIVPDYCSSGNKVVSINEIQKFVHPI